MSRWLKSRGKAVAESLFLAYLVGFFVGLLFGAWLDEMILK